MFLKPATVERLGPGDYLVTGCATGSDSYHVPSTRMTLQKFKGRWHLFVDGARHTAYATLRIARLHASRVDAMQKEHRP